MSLSHRSFPARLAALALPFALGACNGGGGGGGGGGDTDAGDLSAVEGLYEVTSWSDDPTCGGGGQEFPPFGMDLELDGDIWRQTPCASESSCDIPNDLYATDLDGAGPDGLREVEDAAYNASADACQFFFNKRVLTFSGSKVTFERYTITEAYEAGGANTDEACRGQLSSWERTGDRADCTNWEGTLLSSSDDE